MYSKMSKEQEMMNLVYQEIELAIREGNSPFAAIVTDLQNNIIFAGEGYSYSKISYP